MNNSLDIFDNTVKQWFEETIGTPTAVQDEAWPAIASGAHTLVSAPTGTGKTLSAFLVFIDRLKAKARAGELKSELKLIYISPLKSLAGDIRENLKKPLNGILQREINNGESSFEKGCISMAIRTGDTSASERREMLKKPPHILITTPESLYLLVTSLSGQAMLRTAEYVIIDELHAMIESKRGAHLMLTLARLDKLCGKQLQRVGLSATVEPPELAAEYLTASRIEDGNVCVVAPVMEKKIEIVVVSPLSPSSTGTEPGNLLPRPPSQGTIWHDIARSVYFLCENTHSVIAFVGGRMYAEKLAYYVNRIAGEDFARTHHGCVSKEQRLQTEAQLRNGELRLLCATSSMELGIDVGDIDRVLQIGCPFTISSLMQRLGRAGHNPGRTSVMYMFPRTSAEGLYCGLTARAALDRNVEQLDPPRLCLDVLAQHLVSMATGDGYDINDIMEILQHAYPFKDVTCNDVKSTLSMLAGDYEHKMDIPVRPRILYDRINGKVEGDTYSRMLAVSAGGTIPDTGMFAVKTENGAKLGELDEEFVFESRVGDKFLLGSFAWKIVKMDKDTVTVAQSSAEGARPPFWRHAWLARKMQTGIAFGKITREISEIWNDSLHKTENDQNKTESKNLLIEKLKSLGLDDTAAFSAAGFLERQLKATGVLPDDRTIIVEHFSDDSSEHQLMVHSIFGKKVNEPLGILLQETAKRVTGSEAWQYDDDDGILLMSNSGREFPRGLVRMIDGKNSRQILEAILFSTPVFNMTFRYNANRALMMGARKGKRQPLWVQRIRSAEMLDSIVKHPEHPLIRETRRECMEDYWDLNGLNSVLTGIDSGLIKIQEIYNDEPSPLSLPLRRQAEAELLYNYFPTTGNISQAAQDALDEVQKIKPASEQLAVVSENKKLPENEKQLHSLLMIEGDLIAGEPDVPIEWFETLAGQNRIRYIEPGLWIAAEHTDEYNQADFGAHPPVKEENYFQDGITGTPFVTDADRDTARLNIVRRALRYKGALYPEQISERYFLPDQTALELLEKLCRSGAAVQDEGLYYHADLYERARRATISARRKQINTSPPENFADALINHSFVFGQAKAPGQRSRHISPEEQTEQAIKDLCGLSFPPAVWENILLPSRIRSYRPNLLDLALANGTVFWNMTKNIQTEQTELGFFLYDDIDWDATPSAEDLNCDEQIIYDALTKRGASFTTALTGLVYPGKIHGVLFSLMEKGLIHADSFIPARQWMEKDKTSTAPLRRQVKSRVMTMTAGRWDISRPLKKIPAEHQLERIFGKTLIVCRETVRNTDISWTASLELLRVKEYTGQVRRGYFVQGLSGAQFVNSTQEKDFQNVISALENPSSDVIWIPAIDPYQPWGKYLLHSPDRSFARVPGTVVAIKAGLPVAVLEKQGKSLRVFENKALPDALRALNESFLKGKIFPSLNRLVIKSYPEFAADVLKSTNFSYSIPDFELYKK